MKYPNIPWREMAGMRDKVIHFHTECYQAPDEELSVKRGIVTGDGSIA